MDRSQFVATLLVILAVAISSFVSTSILSARLVKMELKMDTLVQSVGPKQ
jgi:hypothetical protein